MAFLGQNSTSVKVAGTIGTGTLLLAIILHILCLATPYYFTLSSSDAKDVTKDSAGNETVGIHLGLWHICVDAGNISDDHCYRLVQDLFSWSEQNEVKNRIISPDWLTAPRTLSILGLIIASMGTAFLVAFVLTQMKKWPYLFLGLTTGTCIIGGILILSGDIAFAANRTIFFYAHKAPDKYFFSQTMEDADKTAHFVQQYDSRFKPGWSFILDLICGTLCIVAGPIFTFIALKLKWSRDLKDKRPFNDTSRTLNNRF